MSKKKTSIYQRWAYDEKHGFLQIIRPKVKKPPLLKRRTLRTK